MAATDKPHIDFTFSDLDKVEKPEPFVYANKAGRRVTFPDPFDLTSAELAKFMRDVENNPDNDDVLRRWLSEEDYENLRADSLSARQDMVLVEKVQAHYQAALGDQGEGAASPS